MDDGLSVCHTGFPRGCSSVVEHLLCKQGVGGSSPPISTGNRRSEDLLSSGGELPPHPRQRGGSMTRSVGWAGLHRTTCVRRCVVAHVQVRTRRDGSRSYKVVWRVGGKEVSKTFRRRREADAYKTEMEHQLNVGTYVDPNRGKVTLAEFWHYFLATSGPASPSTRALYGMQARRYLI